jgi:hypothetical protein
MVVEAAQNITECLLSLKLPKNTTKQHPMMAVAAEKHSKAAPNDACSFPKHHKTTHKDA